VNKSRTIKIKTASPMDKKTPKRLGRQHNKRGVKKARGIGGPGKGNGYGALAQNSYGVAGEINRPGRDGESGRQKTKKL